MSLLTKINKILLIASIGTLVFGGGIYLYINQNSTKHEEGHSSDTSSLVDLRNRGYNLEVTSNASNVKSGQPITFSYKVKNDKGTVLKNYIIAHEKIMHFIVVRYDLQNFQHLHPDYNKSTGEFSINVTFPEDGQYRMYPDFTSGDNNPQKLPVTLNYDVIIGNTYTPRVVSADAPSNKPVDGYQIKYNVPTNVKKQKEIMYTLTVSKNNQPVTNLEPYLGALGHSVIIKENTLDFIHTHAVEGESHGAEHKPNPTSSGTTGPDIKFATTFAESGKYKSFTQFQHQEKVITTEFMFNVN